MKLYLSSFRLGNNPEKLVAMVGKNKKVAFIANATDYCDKITRNEKVKEGIANLEELGFEVNEIDLRDYFEKTKELAKKMTEFSLIFVRGGNVFLLRRAFAQSGFDKWLMTQKDNKDLVYGGYSAGCCILSPSLKGFEIVDDPYTLTPYYKPEIIWEGLGLLDYAFVPHFESDHPESESVSRQVEYFKKNGVVFKALHDGEVIITEA